MKILIFVITGLIFSGCIPIPAVYSSYYMPTYENGKTRSPGCVGPKTKVFFQLPENIDFEVRTDNALGNTSVEHPIILHFRIPKGVSFQFVDDKIRAEGSLPESKVFIQNKLRVESINYDTDTEGLFDFDKRCPIDAKTIKQNGQLINSSLVFSAKTDEFKNDFPDQIEFTFQPIMLDGNTISFDSMHLKSHQINQHRHYYMSAYKTPFEECAIHPEQKDCQDYYALWQQKGYSASNDYFSISGRVMTYDDERSITVSRNQLMIKTAKPWRLSIPVVKILDKSTGTIFQGNPVKNKTTYECGSYMVPMTTRIQVESDEAAKFSDVYIDGSIENLQNKEITIFLPSVLINGKKFDFKPVKIYLKVLDAEILPFNC